MTAHMDDDSQSTTQFSQELTLDTTQEYSQDNTQISQDTQDTQISQDLTQFC